MPDLPHRTTRAAVVGDVADLLTRVPVGHALRVAVDGITGSGKTTFARELAAGVHERGRPCITVSMDGFHQPRAVRYRQGRESGDGYYDDAYDFGAARSVLLDPLGPAGDGRYATAVIDLASDTAVEPARQSAAPGLVLIVDGSFLQRRELRDGFDVVCYLRASFAAARERGAARDAQQLGSIDEARRLFDVRYHAAQRRYLAEVDPERTADIVIDHEDPRDPSVVRVAAELDRMSPYLRRTREFFGARAAEWNQRFHDDGAIYAEAVAALGLAPGEAAVDLGCGRGRALPLLARAVGPSGVALGMDATPEMLTAASGTGADLALADVTRLPLAPGRVDAFFAAGILGHVPDPTVFLRALAAAARPKGRLGVLVPIGRAVLARRHGRELEPDELLDARVLPGVLANSGWALASLDDAERRYLAVATRRD